MRIVQVSREEAIKLITENALGNQEDVLWVPLTVKGEVKSLFDMSVKELNITDERDGMFIYTHSGLKGSGNGLNRIEDGTGGRWEITWDNV